MLCLLHPRLRCPWALTAASKLSKSSDPRSLFRDDAGVVECRTSCRLAVDQHRRAGPYRYTGAAAAIFLRAHDVAPLGAIDVAELMAGADQMSDLVRYCVARRGACVMHHCEGFVG